MPQRILQTVKKAGYQTGLLLLLVGSYARAGDILVTVDGIQATATVHAALVSGAQQRWPEQPLRLQQSDDGQLRLVDLPPGRYAIQLYQDSNGNGQLDHGRRGIPLEPVGFSANPPLLNGKPTPIDSLFEHGTADTQLRIRLQSPKAKK
ncbi:MAG: hypothetical protein CVV09_09330 [Gammaproteobacteria bacterium HGW-Gammaproteobacteria-13]|nr:MAG: hypothetical protein CVV09_09330 [Gammaproteobacteria bacterium HGW-Gammaproteobacteria-13]